MSYGYHDRSRGRNSRYNRSRGRNYNRHHGRNSHYRKSNACDAKNSSKFYRSYFDDLLNTVKGSVPPHVVKVMRLYEPYYGICYDSYKSNHDYYPFIRINDTKNRYVEYEFSNISCDLHKTLCLLPHIVVEIIRDYLHDLERYYYSCDWYLKNQAKNNKYIAMYAFHIDDAKTFNLFAQTERRSNVLERYVVEALGSDKVEIFKWILSRGYVYGHDQELLDVASKQAPKIYQLLCTYNAVVSY